MPGKEEQVLKKNCDTDNQHRKYGCEKYLFFFAWISAELLNSHSWIYDAV